jgi:uncharacterized protein YcfL
MKSRIFLPFAVIGFAAGLLAVSGCKSSVNSVENAQKTGQRQMISDQRVITDRGLAKKVSIVGVNQVTTPGGFLKVQIELLNTTRSPQRFSYRFEWFDATGMLISSPAAPAFPDQIDGGEDKFITGQSPTPVCKDFRVKFLGNTN